MNMRKPFDGANRPRGNYPALRRPPLGRSIKVMSVPSRVVANFTR